MNYTQIFERVEQKYLLTAVQYDKLLRKIRARIEPDLFPHSEISNIYFDSDSYVMLRSSVDGSNYKEKLRLRTYSDSVQDDTMVFLELKKKYQGITYKRRQDLTYRQALDYILYEKLPCNSQIMKEIDYISKKNALKPKVLVKYSRDSYMDDGSDLRLTFDKAIRFRLDNLSLTSNAATERLTCDEVVLELKSVSSMPLWLAQTLNDLEIYPGHFSKYAIICQNHIKKGPRSCSHTFLNQYSQALLTQGLSSYAQQQV